MALTSLFFYGTLRHVPLLERVLGRARQDMDLVDAHLPDHAVYWVKDQPFPMIQHALGTRAPGLVLRGASPQDMSRLNFYEGGFTFDLSPRDVRTQAGQTIPASVFFPEPGQWPQGELWSLEDWEKDWAQLSLRTATEAMSGFGTWSEEELAQKMPMIRRRAAAWCAAQARGPSPDHHPGAEDVHVLELTRQHAHFYALQQMLLTYPRYDGTTSAILDREIFVVGDAVSVLIYDPHRDAVLLTEQFRPNVFANGDPSPWVIEPVSGFVDPGETPEETVHREAFEEVGATLDHLELVCRSYSSTGSSTEFVSMYVALADIGDLVESGGMQSEGEDIKRLILSYDDLVEGLRTQRFRDTPLITTALWLSLNHGRLRASP